MKKPDMNLLVGRLRQLANAQAASEASDQQLLQRYVAGRDEDAFAALVHRHGPMVAGVCRRLLGEADAEDAFQATFLVLARKAGSIRKRESLGSWLHGVARRVAKNARSQAERRARGERARPAPATSNAGDDITWAELRTVLDEELGKLSAPSRAPLILCYLEGLTQDEAARRLGWSKSTLRRRLERGRRLLHDRLTRRGLTRSAGLLAVLVSDRVATAALPKAFAAATVKAGLSFAAGQAIGSEFAAHAVKLAQSVLRGMAVAKGSLIASIALALSLLAGIALFALQAGADKPAANQDPEAAAPPRQDPKPIADPVDRFGDSLPPEAVARLGTIRLQHGGVPWAIAFAPDGRTIATGSSDGMVHIWETTSGQERLRIKNEEFPGLGSGLVQALAFAPDGKILAGARINQRACLWDVATGKELRQFGGKQHRADWVEFSSNGTILAYGGSRKDQSVRLADVTTGQDLHEFGEYKGAMSQVKFSPDGKTIASADDAGILLFEFASGKVRELPRPEGRGLRFHRLAFLPDGRMLSAGSYSKKTIQLVQIPSGKILRTITLAGKREEVGPILFTPDGKTLISGHEDGMVRFWEVSSGMKAREFRAHSSNLIKLALSRDGKTLASSSSSMFNGEHAVRLWDTATGKPLVRLPGPQQGIHFVAFSADSRHVATASSERATHLWEAATGKLLREWKAFGPIVFTRDGRSLLHGGWTDGKVRLLNLVNGDETRQFQAHSTGVSRLCLSRDGTYLATSGDGDSLRLWDLGSGQVLQNFGGKRTNPINYMALSPDAKYLAAVDTLNNVQLWDTGSGKLLREHREERVYNLAFSSDNRILAVARSRSLGVQATIRLLDVATGREINQFPSEGAEVLAFSPDGRTLIGGGQREKQLYVWEVATGQLRHKFAGHQGHIGCLAFSPNGRMIATGNSDASALIWDVTGARQRQRPVPPLRAAKVDQLWNDLASSDAAVGYQAICAFRAAPRQAVSFLARHLKPVPRPDPKEVVHTLRDLASEQFAVRDRARQKLEAFGEAAEPALRQALTEKPLLEVRRRLEQLLQRLEGPSLLRRSRALEVIEHIADADSRQTLTLLANGAPQARLTKEAQAALERLKDVAVGQ